MKLQINNCNNIDSGVIEIDEGRLNIKYAINGTGKSTISKVILYSLNKDKNEKELNNLIPFKYLNNVDNKVTPEVIGLDNVNEIEIFNEEYVEKYIYLPDDELRSNSFEIFVKPDNYDDSIKEIENLVNEIKKTFENNPELDELLNVLSIFIDSYGRATGLSKSGSIQKGLGNGNKTINIPNGLEQYKEYIQNEANVTWLSWQVNGNKYLDIADKCPYCASKISDKNKKESILKLSEEYNSKDIEHLNKIINIFRQLSNYFTEETNLKIDEISKSISGITKERKEYLIDIKKQAETLKTKLSEIKDIGFESLKDVDKVIDTLENYKIDIPFLTHFNSEYTKTRIKLINQSIDKILKKAGILQGKIAKQKKAINKTIEKNQTEINEFLKYAGYKYNVFIDIKENNSYKLKIRHNEYSETIKGAKGYLSFGEKNALALVLFMYGAISSKPDLIILDDPISSFDTNKKFAIINMLFMGKTCFKGRTILLLTHDFETIIDMIYNVPYNFYPIPRASFITNNNGKLKEKEIKKESIKNIVKIIEENATSLDENIIKMIYLRRLYELYNDKNEAWHLISNLLHKRKIPIKENDKDKIELTIDEIKKANTIINKHIPNFEYDKEYKKITDTKFMIELYKNATNNYEKLQLYRIIIKKNNNEKIKGKNIVIRKFINETFHIENEYLFQLNPMEYEIVPQYIIEECDKDILLIEEAFLNIS